MASRQNLKVVRGGAQEAAQAPSEDGHELTIDELARETGMTVRNIRAHQARGLLPPPEVRMRIGYYGPEHVQRLRMILDLQAQGFNLQGIKRLFEDAQGRPEALLGLAQAATAPFETEAPEVFTRAELDERFGDDEAMLSEAQKLGVLVAVGEGRFEAPSPSLLDAAEEVMSRGVPLPAALEVVESLKRHSEAVSRRFVKLFLEEVWKPYEDAGYPEDELPDVIESIERLRPLASKALMGVFQLTMTREVEEAFGRELRKRSRGKR
jgi:DNA-binding transcriptional MerR regulator